MINSTVHCHNNTHAVKSGLRNMPDKFPKKHDGSSEIEVFATSLTSSLFAAIGFRAKWMGEPTAGPGLAYSRALQAQSSFLFIEIGG